MSAPGDPLPLAVRAHAVPATRNDGEQAKPAGKRQRRRRVDPARRPKAILVVDCETTTDPSQALSFGCYRYYRLEWNPAGPTLTCVAEGLFHADDLATRDPAAFETLSRYTTSHQPAASNKDGDAPRSLGLLPRAAFVEGVLFPAMAAQATIITFNALFDLSRIGIGWGEARGKGFEGGFSFALASHEQDGIDRENRYRPRLRVRPIDSKRARLGLTRTPRGADPDAQARGRGAFIDLRTFAYALTGRGHSLQSACAAFGVHCLKRRVVHGLVTDGYISYCREDVPATADLYQALASEYEHWGLARAPTRVYSPASLAKAYLHESGILPASRRQPDFPVEVLGYSLVSYFGGRAEVRVRRVPVPVVYLDFAGAYPTTASLLGLWRFFTCERIEVIEDDPAETEGWLAQLTVDDAFDPAIWPSLCGLGLVEPRGEILPARARWNKGGSYGIGLNPLTCYEPLWYTLPDLLAAQLLGGQPPRLRRVLRFHPVGKAKGLRPFRIRGSRPIDPEREDVFRTLVEDRRRLERVGDLESLRTAAALKTVAASASYGITVQLDRREARAERVAVVAHGLDRFQTDAPAAEVPGEFFFPPIGCLVTGGARLLLAMVECLVTDPGGAWASADTDSMAVVATEQGGLVPCSGGSERDEHGRRCVRALSWGQVDRIVERFGALNPYDPTLVPGSILELEEENLDPSTGERRQLHCFAISAKRTCLYALDGTGQPVPVKWSEHALGGFYLNPSDPESDDRDWVCEAWEWILRGALGLDAPEPAWLDRPALTRFTASHPRLLKPFASWNAGKCFAKQIKPGNFLLVAHAASGGLPSGADPGHFALIAPYEPDPSKWERIAWRNVYDPDGPGYRISGDSIYRRDANALPRGVVGVKTYRDVLDRYRTHAEPKSLGPDGLPCTRATIGLLSRRPLQALTVAHVGREANLLAEIQAGLVGDEEETLVEYRDSKRGVWDRLILRVLRELPVRETAAAAGIGERTLKDLRAGRARPTRSTRDALSAVAVAHARASLASDGIAQPRSDDACLARYLEELAHRPARRCDVCGAELRGRQRRWCARCKKRPRLRLRSTRG
jgi:hypothetical protein